MSPETLRINATSHITRDVSFRDTLTCVGYSDSDRARFWAKVKKGPRCWMWTGYRLARNGYGQMSMGRRRQPHYAHRIAWVLANGPIPDGMHVLHSCDVPACVNPDHLFLGTHRQNMQDAARKGRLSVPRPRRQRVSDDEVSHIRQMAASGLTGRYIAACLGVSRGFVSLVLSGKRRQHTKRSA